MPYDGLLRDSDVFAYRSLGSSTGVVISANQAVLHNVCVLVAGSTAAVVTVYDAATIATSDTTTDKWTFKGDAVASGSNLLIDGIHNTGIVVKNEGGTPGTYLITHKRF